MMTTPVRVTLHRGRAGWAHRIDDAKSSHNGMWRVYSGEDPDPDRGSYLHTQAQPWVQEHRAPEPVATTKRPRRRKGEPPGSRGYEPPADIPFGPDSGTLPSGSTGKLPPAPPKLAATVGGAAAPALADAAARDGATFVKGSECARAHVRHAPPSERSSDIGVPPGAIEGAPTRVLVGQAGGGVEELSARYVL